MNPHCISAFPFLHQELVPQQDLRDSTGRSFVGLAYREGEILRIRCCLRPFVLDLPFVNIRQKGLKRSDFHKHPDGWDLTLITGRCCSQHNSFVENLRAWASLSITTTTIAIQEVLIGVRCSRLELPPKNYLKRLDYY